MYISARLAPCATGSGPGMGYHGCNIVIRELSEQGFAAEGSVALSEGDLVRVRLPGAGAMLARIDIHDGRRMRASFLNPVSKSRLGMTLGLAQATRAVA